VGLQVGVEVGLQVVPVGFNVKKKPLSPVSNSNPVGLGVSCSFIVSPCSFFK